MKARMPYQPSRDVVMLMRAVIIYNQVQLQITRDFSIKSGRELISAIEEYLAQNCAET
jgi:hypothetical protein